MRFSAGILASVVAAALALSACNDPSGFGSQSALVVTDTVLLAAPAAAGTVLPTALDVFSADRATIGGGRFPERLESAPVTQEAPGFDLLIRRRNGELVFLPPAAIALKSNAGITEPLPNRSFDALDRVPSGVVFVTDSAVAIRPGAVYVVRSRSVVLSAQQACSQFAKLEPLEVDEAAETVRLRVATSVRFCRDTRFDDN